MALVLPGSFHEFRALARFALCSSDTCGPGALATCLTETVTGASAVFGAGHLESIELL